MNAWETEILERHFARMGARVQVREPQANIRGSLGRFGIDIVTDKRGELFKVDVPQGTNPEMRALQVRPDLRHLLLYANGEKYLCGHDERHWFVAGVQSGGVVTVEDAMRSLRPLPDVALRKVRNKDRLKRRNEAYVRQGEWFFIPAPRVNPPASMILRHEPLSRGDGGKPHWCEEVYRDGGTPVYVCDQHPRGVSTQWYRRVLERNPAAAQWNWRLMYANAQVIVRGKISHPDHKTLALPFWHGVVMNREHNRGVVFLD